MQESNKEILRSSINNPIILEPIVKQVFQDADLDKNGIIDKVELGKCMVNMGKALFLDTPDQNKIEEEYKRWDVDENGVIDFKEFSVFVRETLLKIVDDL